jgi:chitodextrinase
MPHTRRRRALAALVAATAVATTLLTATPASAAAPDLGQKVAVPAYIPPSDSTSWGSLLPGDAQLDFIVVNVANGPDTTVNTSWETLIDSAHAAGTKVLGYVDSGYFGGSVPQRLTAFGETDPISWLVQAEQDVDQWYELYGDSIDGIFIDDGMNICGTATDPDLYIDLYTQLNEYIKANHEGALTVLNPGITVPECYADTADVLVTYEGSAADYLSPTPDRATAQWQLDEDPMKFWHIIYDVAPSQITTLAEATKQNNAGYVYYTPDVMANPYDIAPTGSYWTEELASTKAVSAAVPAAPARPVAVDVYSTGVDLSWAGSSNTDVVGYEVYRDGIRIGSMSNSYPATTEFTDDTLSPTSTYVYTTRARHLNGQLSTPSVARTVTTDGAWGAAPSPPASPSSSNLTANGVRLSWTGSVAGNDPVAFYDVYRGATRVAVVNASVTSVHLGYLLPGTAYDFTVVARTTSGTTSTPSSIVAITTPDPAPIADAAVDFGPATTTFEAQFNLAYSFRHVYIDADGSATTGLQVGGIGADYMIENGSFFQHSTGANAWDWTAVPLSVGPLVSSTGGRYVWEVPSAQFGGATSLNVVFSASGGSPDETLAPIVAAQHG